MIVQPDSQPASQTASSGIHTASLNNDDDYYIYMEEIDSLHLFMIGR